MVEQNTTTLDIIVDVIELDNNSVNIEPTDEQNHIQSISK